MLRTKRSIVVDAPVDKVFNYLADVTRHHEWHLGSQFQFTSTTSEPLGLVSTFESEGWDTRMGGQIPVRLIMKITEFVPNERIVFDRLVINVASGGKILNHDIFSFEVQPTDSRTRVTKTSEVVVTHVNMVVRLLAVPLMYLLSVIIVPLASWWEGRYLRRLKLQVESM